MQNTKKFQPVKKPSPFNSDPFNNRGGKSGKHIATSSNAGVKAGKKLSINKVKVGGSGGDR